MTEQDWLVSSDPAAMLRYLQGEDEASNLPDEMPTDRNLRLFACACCRLRGRSDAEVDEMERTGFPNMEDAEAPITDLEWATRWTHYSYGSGSPKQHNEQPRMEVRAALLRDIFGNPFRLVSFMLVHSDCASQAAYKIAQAIYDERAFDRMPVLADALEEAGCREEAILRHCRGEEPHFVHMLNDPGTWQWVPAGWRPLRGPHVRGCWVLDLVLGRE